MSLEKTKRRYSVSAIILLDNFFFLDLLLLIFDIRSTGMSMGVKEGQQEVAQVGHDGRLDVLEHVDLILTSAELFERALHELCITNKSDQQNSSERTRGTTDFAACRQWPWT